MPKISRLRSAPAWALVLFAAGSFIAAGLLPVGWPLTSVLFGIGAGALAAFIAVKSRSSRKAGK